MTQNIPFPTVAGEQQNMWIFDAVMAEIEPDLTHAVAPTLKEKYHDESAADRAERLARYERTLALFDEMLPQILAMFEEDTRLTVTDQN